MKRRNPFILTTWWVIVAVSLCILRPNGSLKFGVIMLALTVFPLIIDVARRKFGNALKAPAKTGGDH